MNQEMRWAIIASPKKTVRKAVRTALMVTALGAVATAHAAPSRSNAYPKSTQVLATAPAGVPVAVNFADLVERVSGGVVRISVTKHIKAHEIERMRQFFGNRQMPDIPAVEHGYGTGFFITTDGYVLTNHHVVADVDNITVTMHDRTELDAKLVGSDEASDIAVLKVEGHGFPALKVAQADTLRVGEPVLAIGSPFGFDYSASAGIVSAKSRNFSKEATVPFIQSDVALNMGNSGGPLFNQQGEVVGINSLIFSGTGGYMGLSFSIPIDAAMGIYEQIKATGKVRRVYLGVSVQDLDRNLAEAYGMSRPQGALLTSVFSDSPADRIGLKRGDVVLSFNGQNIIHAADLLNLINKARPEDSFHLTYQRGNATMRTQGRLMEAPSDMSTRNDEHRVRLGLRVRSLNADERLLLRQFGIDGGMTVTAIESVGLAARAGIQAGDVIISLNQRPTSNPASFTTAVQSLPRSGVVTVELMRAGTPAIIGLRVE